MSNAIDKIPGVTMRIHAEPGKHYLFLASERPLRTLSTAPWNGGYGHYRYVMNRQVDKSYMCDDPLREMSVFLDGEGYDHTEVAGMLTAAYVRDVGFYDADSSALADPAAEIGEEESMRVCAWVTMGLGNTARAGLPVKPQELFPGTINSILLIDGCLSDAALANCIITATEAKSAALEELGVKVRGDSRYIATGTTTDAVVVAATGRGRQRDYAGTATWLGHLVGRTVYEASLQSGRRYLETVRN